MSQNLNDPKSKPHKNKVSVAKFENESNNGLNSNEKATNPKEQNSSKIIVPGSRQNSHPYRNNSTFFSELRRYTFASPDLDDEQINQLRKIQKVAPPQKSPLPSPKNSEKSLRQLKIQLAASVLSSKEKLQDSSKDKTSIESNVYDGECEIYVPSSISRRSWRLCFSCCSVCSIRRRLGFIKSIPPKMKPGKWKKVRLVLKSDSTLMIHRDQTRRKACLLHPYEVSLSDVGEFISYGAFTQGVPGRPPGLKKDELILMIPEEPRTNGRTHWLRLRDRDDLHQWLLAICSVLKLPAPPHTAPIHHSSRETTATITGYHMSGTPYLSSFASTSMADDSLTDVNVDDVMSLTFQVDTGLQLLAKYKHDHHKGNKP